MPGFNIGGDGTGQPNTVEVSRKHRFLVRILNPLSRDLLFFAHKFSLPPLEIDRVVMHHKQEEIYLPGKHRYQQCEIGFYRAHDGEGDRAAREIYAWWAKGLLDVDASTLLADPSGTPYKRTCEVHILDGFGETAYKYILYGVWPGKVSPDSLDFSDNNVSDINLTLNVDKVKEEKGAVERNENSEPCEDGEDDFEDEDDDDPID